MSPADGRAFGHGEPDPAERDHRVQELGKVARDLARGDTVILAEK